MIQREQIQEKPLSKIEICITRESDQHSPRLKENQKPKLHLSKESVIIFRERLALLPKAVSCWFLTPILLNQVKFDYLIRNAFHTSFSVQGSTHTGLEL